jgi:hypothetical protein
MDRRLAAGYVVWGATAIVVGVPEIWALAEGSSGAWPTISGTVGRIEYSHNWFAILVVVVLVWAAFHAVRVSFAATVQLVPGGRMSRARRVRFFPALVYFPAGVLIVVGASLGVHLTYPHDHQLLGEVLYGSIGLTLVVVPGLLAYRPGIVVPFATLFATLRDLERRLPVVAVLVASGVAVLAIHLVLYPWPRIIPDVQRLHAYLHCRETPQRSCPPLKRSITPPSASAP